MATTTAERVTVVSCPRCEQETAVSVPDTDAEIVVRRSVALYGEHTTAVCPDGHRFWVYFC
ncbi:hypothetical protein [Natronorubrum aibiense]|uniref:Uncharacterized protein n=1 Tax=Natronorubrum aibiense TaxID=348826 RepID=A0A5P9P5P8_9EURY|nr:hypothetical protein [Natronorubrum aibiense]QFU83463.1 hypothetical protein GCU68_13390 [Natronorubrum aibiense]